MVLNENLDVNAIDDTVRRAFRGVPEKVLLKPPTRLYKWTNQPLLAGAQISPWWSFVEPKTLPSGKLVEGFHVAEERAGRLGKSHREFERSRAAISGQFGNAMTHLIVISLTVDAWALAGQASGQPEFAKHHSDLQHVVLIGGAQQVWIPNLTPLCVQQLPAAV